jgi:hypothetical protein
MLPEGGRNRPDGGRRIRRKETAMDRQIFEAVNHEVVRRLGEGRRPADLSAEELSALITGAIEAAVAVVVPRVYGEMISRGQHLPPTPDRSLGAAP